MTQEAEAGMTQEAEGQRRLTANATTAPAQRTAQGQDVGGAEIGDVPGLDVAPHLLDWIEIGRVRGQPLDVQPPALAREIPGHAGALVSGQPIPQQDHRRTAEVPLEGAQEPDERDIGVRPRPRLKVEAAAPAIPAKRQRGGDGQAPPIGPGMTQDWRVPPRGPRPPDYGLVGEAAFVFEDEPGAPAAGVFFARRQPALFHAATAAALCSRDCRAGRWTDQFSARKVPDVPGMEPFAGEPGDDGRHPGQGPEIRRETMRRGALQQGPFDSRQGSAIEAWLPTRPAGPFESSSPPACQA
jgi:hypothetical protein